MMSSTPMRLIHIECLLGTNRLSIAGVRSNAWSVPTANRRRTSGDVEECCAPKGQQAATRGTAIELRVAAVKKRRVGIEEGRKFGVATAQDRKHAGKIVTRARSGGEQCLNAGRVTLRISIIGIPPGRAGMTHGPKIAPDASRVIFRTRSVRPH
jgi:hypothetical protein